MLMHHKIIMTLALIAVACFFAIKFNVWLIVIALVSFALIFQITGDKDVRKIVVPATAIMIVVAFVFGFFNAPSADELQSKLNVYEADLSRMKSKLTEKERELTKARYDQGWLKTTFKDSEKVNHLERQVEILLDEIAKLEKDIYGLKKKLRR
jgi:septal ring factor EnvC (AmiA/AmiB activator)